MRSVGMKSAKITVGHHVKASFWGKIDAKERNWARGNRIRYPGTLNVNDEWWFLVRNTSGSEANVFSIPPCEYDGIENKKISRSRSKRSEACYLIR